MEKRLQELLLLAFTPFGEVRLSALEARKQLIVEANAAYPDTNFGNPKTGVMDIEKFREVFFSNI